MPIITRIAIHIKITPFEVIIAQKEEKVNQNASKSACPATSDQLDRIAADLNGNTLDSVCHAVSPPP
jgi:hypothetical protein